MSREGSHGSSPYTGGVGVIQGVDIDRVAGVSRPSHAIGTVCMVSRRLFGILISLKLEAVFGSETRHRLRDTTLASTSSIFKIVVNGGHQAMDLPDDSLAAVEELYILGGLSRRRPSGSLHVVDNRAHVSTIITDHARVNPQIMQSLVNIKSSKVQIPFHFISFAKHHHHHHHLGFSS